MPPISTLKNAVKKTPLWPLLRPRRTHVYGVGAPKTGTTSIATLFADNYRATHEVHTIEMTRLIKDRRAGRVTWNQAVQTVRWLDRKWRLECESAHFLAHVCDVLAEALPRSRFILTVREPRSWLRSIIDQCVKNPRTKLDTEAWKHMIALRDLYFGPPPAEYDPHEAALAEHNLHAMDGYLAYWTYHNRMVLDAVPPNRLLILRTRDLSNRLDRIATFAGIQPATLAARRSHANKAPKKRDVLSEIDEDYVQAKIAQHCSEMVNRLQQRICA